MIKHADERSISKPVVRTIDVNQRSTKIVALLAAEEREEVEKELDERRSGPRPQEVKLAVFDATSIVGLHTIVYDAAVERIDEEGERSIEIPKLAELLASAAVARCMMPERLRGSEIRAIRHILKFTLSELAKRLDEKTAIQTVSRWETEAQPMGVYAEKFLRLLVCEELWRSAPAIEYKASKLVNLRIRDPWKMNPDHDYPMVELGLVSMKEPMGLIIEAWNDRTAA